MEKGDRFPNPRQPIRRAKSPLSLDRFRSSLGNKPLGHHHALVGVPGPLAAVHDTITALFIKRNQVLGGNGRVEREFQSSRSSRIVLDVLHQLGADARALKAGLNRELAESPHSRPPVVIVDPFRVLKA